MAFLSGWGKRIQLTIDKDVVDTANQANFPVMVYLSAASGIGDVDVSAVFNELTSDENRKKIAVTSSDGVTELYVEIDQWDDANEKAWLHVKVPSVAYDADTILYLYYDANHADNDTYVGDTTDAVTHNVWDANFKAVYHMAQDPNGDGADAIKDSTSNQNDMTPEGTMLTEDLVDGKVGKCLVFDGSDDCLIVSDNASMDFTGGLTVEAIIEGDGETIIAGQWDTAGGDGDQRCFNLQINASKKVQGAISPTGTATDVISEGTTVIQAATWYHIVFMCDLTNQYIYLNGNQEDSDASVAIINSTDYLTIAAIKGNVGTTGAWRDGKIDEVRFSNIARSAAWIKATYNSLWDSLITFGAEEEPGGGTVIAEPLSGILSLSGDVIGPMAVAADPLELVGSISGVGVYIPRSQITGTLTLINSLKVGGTLTLINSLNVQVSGSISLVNSVLQKIEGSLTLRNDIEELAKFNGTLGLINHILDADSGVTQGDYYFLESHGL